MRETAAKLGATACVEAADPFSFGRLSNMFDQRRKHLIELDSRLDRIVTAMRGQNPQAAGEAGNDVPPDHALEIFHRGIESLDPVLNRIDQNIRTLERVVQ